MDFTRVGLGGALTLALVLGGAGCGKAAEKVAEEAAEEATGCEDIDASGEEVGAECDGAQISADDEGNVAITDEQGNEIEVGGDATLPDDWPDDLPLPDGTTIVSSSSAEGPPASLTVVATLDGDVSDVIDEIKGTLEKADYTIDGNTTAPEGRVATLAATGSEYTASVTVSESPDNSQGDLTLGYTLSAVSG